jgi:hypothetical protein
MEFEDLRIDEAALVREWVQQQGGVVGDHTCKRIEWLVAQRLQRVATDPPGWETLLRDPRDGRLWEHTFPKSEMHGGGPPTLRLISPAVAAAKYRVS